MQTQLQPGAARGGESSERLGGERRNQKPCCTQTGHTLNPESNTVTTHS
jgi:hypothetical protein